MTKLLARHLVGLFTLSLVCMTGCTENAPSEREAIRLRFDWISNASFLGDFAAKRIAAADTSMPELILQEAGMGIDPIRMVITGQSDVGIASFEQILQAIDKGADLVIIGQINTSSPTVFITPASWAIVKPEDILGKRIGINPGGATEYVYRSFVEMHQLDPRRITEVPADFDLKGWINGTYDGRLAFAYVEPLLLDQAGVSYNICRPDSFGVRYPGRFYFVERSYLEKHKDLVQSFISLAVDGWKSALSSPAQPIADMKQFAAQVDTAFEARSFRLAVPYYLGHEGRLLDFDTLGIEQSILFLHSIGVVNGQHYKQNFESSFVQRAVAK